MLHLKNVPLNSRKRHSRNIIIYSDKVPAEQRSAVNFNGGGFDNHRIFWNNTKSNGGGEPTGTIADAIKTSFGSSSALKRNFLLQLQ